MQVESHILYGRRAVYYLSKTFADQLQTREDYSHLDTAIGIHFLDFKYFPDDRLLHQFVFKDVETNDTHSELSRMMRLYFIEMPKLAKGWGEIVTALERWVAFLNMVGLDQDELPEQLAADPALVRAVNELERAGLSLVEREVYEGEARKKMVDAVQLRDAEQRGEQRGEQKGMLLLLTRQITRRLGDAPASIVATLQGLNAEALDALDLALPDLHTYADVEQWLKRYL